MHYTIGPKGTRTTVGIPGTGLSWTQYTPYQKSPIPEAGSSVTPALPLKTGINPLFEAIDTESVKKLSALSTSEWAPILNEALRRPSLVPFGLVASLAIFVVALWSGDQNMISFGALYAAILIPSLIYLDRYRRSIRITYELVGTAKTVATTLAETFGDLRNCAKVWNVRAQGRTSDWKRNARATTLSDRKRIYPAFDRPRAIRGTVTFPALKTSAQELYFLPDALLVVKNKSA